MFQHIDSNILSELMQKQNQHKFLKGRVSIQVTVFQILSQVLMIKFISN